MMKINTTMRAAMPAISQVRAPEIRVRSLPRAGGRGEAGAGGAGGAEPLTEGGGRVLVVAVARGAAGSVMTLLPPRSGTGSMRTWTGSLADPGTGRDWPLSPGVSWTSYIRV